MSSKKDKLIEDAQKLVLRGQIDKAIKAYRQIVLQDPSAINQRQKLAELLLKAGSVEAARAEFESIGKFYSGNGFYLKAIAVYKKLQVMYPGDIGITLTLADLNEKHGLAANALAEYKQVYDFYKKQSKDLDALKILERMHNVDRQNIGIKLMLSEAYFQCGKIDESYAAYSALATLLYDKGDNAACLKLNDRIKQHFPQKPDIMLEVLAKQVEGGNASGAVNGLQTLLQQNPRDKRLWELIIDAFRQMNEQGRVKAACQHFLKFFPEELSARKNYLECLLADKDVQGTLALLEQYEQDFINCKATAELVSIYKALDQLDPINVHILQGVERACRADGDLEYADAMASKIASLQSLADKHDGKSVPDIAKNEVLADLEEDVVLMDIEEPLEDQVFPELADSADISEFQPLGGDARFAEEADEEIEIDIEIDGEEALVASTAGFETSNWLDSVDDIFDAIVETPRSVKFGSEVDVSDAQSHYDLGVAFKEMGLLDEAISEFRQAAADPSRKVACLVLQGGCLREKGDMATAENLLRSLLNAGLGVEDTYAVKYDLALTCEAAGKAAEAAALLAEIDSTNPGFRDVHARLDAAATGTSLDFSDDELDDFELK